MISSVVMIMIVGHFGQIESIPAERVPVVWLTGLKFRQEIEQPFSGSWSNVELRQILKQVAADRRISILLDRRLDPSVELPIDVTNVSLRTGLTGIAKQADGDASLPENIVFLGPKSATKNLRTLIELRSIELQSKEAGISAKRRTELLRRRTFEWSDLDTPREILDAIADQARLSISNRDVIPHDLWAATTLPEVSVPEGLSVVLIQFDLTFRWVDRGATIELVPVPDSVSLQRQHHPTQKLADAIKLIRQRFPRLNVEISNTDIVVQGALEDHEAISNLLRGDRAASPIKIEPPQPIRQRVFTLKAERVPISALMKKLEESAISFDFDGDEFTAAGIDLERKIQLDVKQVSAENFFKSIFGPIGVEFQIDHLTVKLKPKKKE